MDNSSDNKSGPENCIYIDLSIKAELVITQSQSIIRAGKVKYNEEFLPALEPSA